MTPEELKARVDEILSHEDDTERTHVEEDNLTEDLVKEFAPEWVFPELDRLVNLRRRYA